MSPCRYDQPYQYALYMLGVLLEARRWHVSDYETVLPGVTAEGLQVRRWLVFDMRVSQYEAVLQRALSPVPAVALPRFLQGEDQPTLPQNYT